MEFLYSKDKLYKFEKPMTGGKSFFYTGRVIIETEILIQIKTERDGEVVLNKGEFTSWEIREGGQ